MPKPLRCLLYALVIALLAYNSVYFKKLDEVKAGTAAFDAAGYAQDFWNKKLTPGLAKATELDALTTLLKTDKEKAFNAYSHALGIGNIRYFMVKGEGVVSHVDENEVKLETGGNAVRIATEYIFGNAVRDASGAMDINAFTNSMDFNNVSAEINKLIREKVVPPFKSKVKKGDRVAFHGAIELNREHLQLNDIEIIPVSLQIEKP
jgi:predicted lipoprotein